MKQTVQIEADETYVFDDLQSTHQTVSDVHEGTEIRSNVERNRHPNEPGVLAHLLPEELMRAIGVCYLEGEQDLATMVLLDWLNEQPMHESDAWAVADLAADDFGQEHLGERMLMHTDYDFDTI